MALITCPECGGQVSDKAVACPHCGYPMKGTVEAETKPNGYALVLNNAGPSKVKCIRIVQKYLNLGLSEAKDMCDNIPREGRILLQCKAEDKSNMDSFLQELLAIGTNAYISEISGDKIVPAKRDDAVHCPRCGSTQITTGQRGYSVFWGPIGSGKTVNRCAKCGYQWAP